MQPLGCALDSSPSNRNATQRLPIPTCGILCVVWRLTLLALAACDAAPPFLSVDLKTDLRPGIEFTSVTTAVLDDEVRLPVSTRDDFFGGQRVGEFELAAGGEVRVLVELLDADSEVIARRSAVARVSGATSITILITSDCVGVECPGDGAPELTECLGARCVAPECVVEDPSACPDPRCASDADCPAPVACASGACTDGVCFARTDDSLCGRREYCDPNNGCTPIAICAETDGDGVSTCDGDCDDADRTTYPGAAEICGDGVANDCAGAADEGCAGVFVAPPPLGDDASPGTRSDPVATIARGIAIAQAMAGADVYVAAGTYSEAIVMADGISLLGGYEPTTWTSDPRANLTVIAATTASGVSIPSGVGADTVLSGFELRGFGAGSDSAATITVEVDASPVIRDNVIEGPNDANLVGAAIRINPREQPSTGSPTIAGNVIRNGLVGISYGIQLSSSSVGIEGNRIELANNPIALQCGIGLLYGAGHRARVDSNVIRGRGMSDWANGIVAYDGEYEISNNDVHPGACTTRCQALSIGGVSSNLTLVATNNVLFGGSEGQLTTGLVIGVGIPVFTPVFDVVVHSNVLDGGGGGISAGVFLEEDTSAPLVIGRFYDNVLRSGGGRYRYAFAEGGTDLDPELVSHNAFFMLDDVGGAESALYLDEGSFTFAPSPMVVGGNRLSSASMIDALAATENNIESNCAIVSPRVDGDFHLGAGSACIDAGVATEAPAEDFEGDPRGTTPDIGVDEVVP